MQGSSLFHWKHVVKPVPVVLHFNIAWKCYYSSKIYNCTCIL